MSCVTSGRPSVRPLSNPVGVTGGRGGIEAQVGYESKPEEFMCKVYALVYEEELKAFDEEDQAEAAYAVSTNNELIPGPLHHPLPVPIAVPSLRRGTRS